MAEENKTAKMTVQHNPDAPVPRRITEAQFQQCPSDWLKLAQSGHQIIVVDRTSQSGPAAMVVGLNGIAFQLPEDEPAAATTPKRKT